MKFAALLMASMVIATVAAAPRENFQQESNLPVENSFEGYVASQDPTNKFFFPFKPFWMPLPFFDQFFNNNGGGGGGSGGGGGGGGDPAPTPDGDAGGDSDPPPEDEE